MILSRRTVLRGTGAMMALPLLECMLNAHGTAMAQGGGALPKRFVVWFFGNGVRLDRWIPAAAGQGNAWQLSPALAPLAKVKSMLNVVTGTEIKCPNVRGHHSGLGAVLSGAPIIQIPAANFSSKFGLKSIDQQAADLIGKGTPFPSLQLQVSRRALRGGGPTLQFLSHRSPDQPMPAEVNPVALFNKLFGNFQGGGGDPAADARNAMRTSVLDAVRDDAKRLNTKLGVADRARLDAHLTSVSEVRQRIVALPPSQVGSCARPPRVTETNTAVNGVEPFDSVNAVMSDLLAIAMACDLTRVASIMFSPSVGAHTYRAINNGAPRNTEHELTHDAASQDKVQEAVVYTMRNLAYTLERLQKTQDGSTNLLDSSAVLVTTDLAEGLRHTNRDYPILVAGRARGALKTDQHIRTNRANSTDVLLSIMQALGTGVNSVGRDTGFSNTPLRAMLA